MNDAQTTLIPVVPEPPPVFVDATGRRRRRLRRLAYGLGLVGLAYTAMVGVSFAGGPVSPGTVLPFTNPTDPTDPVQRELPAPPAAPAATGTPAGSAAVSASNRPAGPARPRKSRTQAPTPSRPATTGQQSTSTAPSPSPSPSETSPGLLGLRGTSS